MGIKNVTSIILNLVKLQNLKFNHLAYRFKSFQSSKIERLTKRALNQQLSWSEKLDYPESDWHSYTNEQVLSYRDRATLPFEKAFKTPEPELLKSYNIEYNGVLKELIIDGFGKISVSHSDIFDSQTDAMLVPIPKCLLPHTGFGLKVIEIGGKDLVKAIVNQAKELIKTTESKELDYGDVIITPSYDKFKSTLLAFIITPYYWQKSRNDAAQRLRYTFKRALNHINSLGISSITCPHIGEALLGYLPNFSSSIIIQESFDAIIQVESKKPKYSLKDISFIDLNKNTAMILAESLQDLERLRIPSKRVIPAPVYYSRSTARVIDIDVGTLKFLNESRKLTFKLHHALRKSRRKHWLSNLKPYVWRTARLYEPPPFMVNSITGEPSEYQLEPKAFYYKGLSHSLFPINRAKIKALKMGINGKWIGNTKLTNITLDRMSQER